MTPFVGSYFARSCITTAALFSSITAAQPVSHDFNNDGWNDFPVSLTGLDVADPITGVVRIWSGVSKAALTTIQSPDTNTLFGWCYGSAGDINQDGIDDLVVGEPLWNPSGALTGRVQIYSGLDDTVLLTVNGAYNETALGRYVTGIGDWNGDGVPDIAASGWDIADLDLDGVGDDAIGVVHVISGVDGTILSEIFEPSADEWFGYSIFSLGDISGDGLDDIAVIDPIYESTPGSGARGALYVFHGRAQIENLDLSDVSSSVFNTDPTIRGFATQVDTMHPDLWLPEPTLQIVSLTENGVGNANDAEIQIDIIRTNGIQAGSKGVHNSLILAGDVNLSGSVTAADLQQVISQLGTDPQALGVMPIADLNSDGIVDVNDAAISVSSYGNTTDIFEGLWDGSRLLSIAASNAGFGSTNGLNNLGGGPFGGRRGPGPRPTGGCDGIIDPTTPLINISPIPWMLEIEATNDCLAHCPSYDEVYQCYSCETPRTIVGGSVSMTPSQPISGDQVTISVSGVTEVPGTFKCRCGVEGTIIPSPSLGHSLKYAMYIYERNTDGSWEDETDANVSHPHGDGVSSWTTFPLHCTEFKSVWWAKASGGCNPVWVRIGEAIVSVADITLTSRTILSAPDGTDDDRKKVGIREVVRVDAVEPGVTVTWTVNGAERLGSSGTHVAFRSPNSPGTVTVTATSGECNQILVFEVIEPSGVQLQSTGDYWHLEGESSVGSEMCIRALPLNVSFKNIRIGEQESDPPTLTGVFAEVAATLPANHSFNSGHVPWALAVREDNYLSLPDKPWTHLPTPNQWSAGTLTWTIPWKYFASTTISDVIDTTVSVTDVSANGSMWIDKTTDNGIYHKSPTFTINAGTDPWDADIDCSD